MTKLTKMNNNAYAFLLQYSSPYSILVVTKENRLIELSCPFEVEVIKNVKNLTIGQIRKVTMVKLATNNKLAFIIEDKPYFYNYFNIII